MTAPPPIPDIQQQTDADHLKLLAIFHYVVAGLAVLGLGFILLHYMMMHSIMTRPDIWKNQKDGGPTPAEFFAIFRWFYLVMGALFIAASVANLLSALFLRKRKHRIFSLIVAGINCAQFPIGTALGVFTFIVLMRNSVRESYAACQTSLP